MTGNISKSKGFKGARGDTGPQGPQGEKGDTSNIYLRYDSETGDLFYTTEHIPSITTAPYIGDNGNWYVFDGTTKEFVDSGVNAQGGVPEQYINEYIDKQTAILKSDIEGIQKDIKNESHFRGYVATNAEIEALKATPNDFVYSAQSGTVWVYDEVKGWVETNTPVPDKGTPLSNATPLINGIASSGTSEEGARSDHRHPTDTTRLGVEEFNNFKNDIKPYIVKPLRDDATNTFFTDKTFDEIFQVYNSGNTNIFLLDSGVLCTLVGASSHSIRWCACISGVMWVFAELTSSGNLYIERVIPEHTSNKAYEISNESTSEQYPTVEAVKTYVDGRLAGQSAEIEEAIDRIIAIQNQLIGGGSE